MTLCIILLIMLVKKCVTCFLGICAIEQMWSSAEFLKINTNTLTRLDMIKCGLSVLDKMDNLAKMQWML